MANGRFSIFHKKSLSGLRLVILGCNMKNVGFFKSIFIQSKNQINQQRMHHHGQQHIPTCGVNQKYRFCRMWGIWVQKTSWVPLRVAGRFRTSFRAYDSTATWTGGSPLAKDQANTVDEVSPPSGTSPVFAGWPSPYGVLRCPPATGPFHIRCHAWPPVELSHPQPV